MSHKINNSGQLIPTTIGVVGVALAIVVFGVRGCVSVQAKKTEATQKAREEAIAFAKANPIIVEFPISGAGHATKQVGLKVWLDPMKTCVRATKPARYVFVEDTDLFFDNTESAQVEKTTGREKKWHDMPAGKYLVYPITGEKLYFQWWQ